MNFVNSIYSKSFLLKKIMNLLLRALRLFLTLIFCLYSSMNETHTHTEKNCSQNLRKTFICMIVSQTFLFLDLQIQSKQNLILQNSKFIIIFLIFCSWCLHQIFRLLFNTFFSHYCFVIQEFDFFLLHFVFHAFDIVADKN